MTKTVYLSGSYKTRTDGHRNVYHDDPECHQLTGDVQEFNVEDSNLIKRTDIELCSCCAGDVDRSHTGPTLANQIEGLAADE